MIHFQLLGLVLGTLYFGQENTQEGVQNINGGLFLILSSLTFSTANGVINVSLVCFVVDLRIAVRLTRTELRNSNNKTVPNLTRPNAVSMSK